MNISEKNSNLRRYLFTNRLSVTEFSKTVDHSRNYISQIVNGKYIPGRRLARIIEKATNGEVKAEQLMKGE